jgi:hypothetical protein
MKALVIRAIAESDITSDTDKALEDCISCVKKEKKDEQLNELMMRLKRAQTEKNNDEMSRLVLRISEIHKEKAA